MVKSYDILLIVNDLDNARTVSAIGTSGRTNQKLYKKKWTNIRVIHNMYKLYSTEIMIEIMIILLDTVSFSGKNNNDILFSRSSTLIFQLKTCTQNVVCSVVDYNKRDCLFLIYAYK